MPPTPFEVEPSADPESGVPPEIKPKRSRSGVGLGVVAGLVAAGSVGAYFGYEPLLRHLVARETQRLGFVVSYDSIQIHGFFLGAVLRGAHVDLEGVPGLHADVDEVVVDLDGSRAQRIVTAGAHVTVERSAADLLLDLGAWINGHPDLYRIPGEATAVAITWSDAPASPAWLGLQGGTLTTNGTDAAFHTPSVTVAGQPLGAAGAAWAAAAATITIGLGNEAIADAPIHLELHPSEQPATALLTLRPTKLESLGAPLGLALPAPGAVAEGSVTISLGTHAGRGAVDGTASFTLTGWVPPHPRELGGIVFGDRTTFATRLAVTEDHRKITLSEAVVTAGALKLKGGGTIERREAYALTTLDFRGSLACSDVARSAVASSWGDLAGILAGDVARIALDGSVGIKVHVEADTRDLKAAKLTHEVGVGCGLRVPKLF
ncbi:MAG: hypothetical protein ABJE95_15130 [Byssovorax sp.]